MSLSCCRALECWVPRPGPRQCRHPGSCRGSGWFSLLGHRSQQGSLAGILTAFCIALLSANAEGPKQGVKTVEPRVIHVNSVLENKGVAQTLKCEPTSLGNSYLLKCR